jgi:hypothetical protein
MSPIQEAPMVRKDVPSKAVRMRKMKYAGRFGAKAVPREHPRKRAAVTRHIYFVFSKTSTKGTQYVETKIGKGG